MEIVSAILAILATFFGASGFANSRGSDTPSSTALLESTTQSVVGTEGDALTNQSSYMWSQYKKPVAAELEKTLDPITYKVTQEEGTERAGTSPLDKNYERVSMLMYSGEPLFSWRDKFDSGTGWPSFTKPIEASVISEHEDRTLLFQRRVEVRSRIADNHLGHVFPDGPKDRGGMRYCLNGVALRFVPESDMVAQGYGDFLSTL